MLSALFAGHNITARGRLGRRRPQPLRPASDELIEIPRRVRHANRKIIQSAAVDRREMGIPSGGGRWTAERTRSWKAGLLKRADLLMSDRKYAPGRLLTEPSVAIVNPTRSRAAFLGD